MSSVVIKHQSKPKGKSKSFFVPNIALRVFALLAILLVPWSIWISYSLPINHIDNEWNLAWSVFDIGLLVSMGATAYFGMRKSGWVVMAATATGTLLLIDAWFDCVTSKNAWEQLLSVSSAAFLELPLGILAFWIAYKTSKQFF
jgi:hypothetical protein